MRIVAVTRDAAHESPAAVARLAPAHHTTLMSSEAWHDFDVPGSPYFVLLDTGGRVVGEGASASWSQVVALLERARTDGALGGSGDRRSRGPSGPAEGRERSESSGGETSPSAEPHRLESPRS
jgi:hypothetical protein